MLTVRFQLVDVDLRPFLPSPGDLCGRCVLRAPIARRHRAGWTINLCRECLTSIEQVALEDPPFTAEEVARIVSELEAAGIEIPKPRVMAAGSKS